MTEYEEVAAAYSAWLDSTYWRGVGDSPEWDAFVRRVRATRDPVALIDDMRAFAGDVVSLTVARVLSPGGDDDATLLARALFDALTEAGEMNDDPGALPN